MNLGSTFYLSNKSYQSQVINSLSYRMNSIYIQNIIILINKPEPCNENYNLYFYNYLLKNNINYQENEVHRIIYPQYYITNVSKITNEVALSNSEEIYKQKYLKYKQKYINYKK